MMASSLKKQHSNTFAFPGVYLQNLHPVTSRQSWKKILLPMARLYVKLK